MANLNSIELETSFIFYLWAIRNNNIIKDVKITKLNEINSFFSFKENTEDIIKDLKGLKEGEGMLIKLKDQNAFLFDCGLIVKNKSNYNLYLFQITLRKDAKERFTNEGLNESISYLNCFLYSKLKIVINKNYFAYIFDNKNPDVLTIEECEKNFIDYYLFDRENLTFSKNVLTFNEIIPKYRFKIRESINQDMQLNNFDDNFIPIRKYCSFKEEDLNNSFDFIKKKRKLMFTPENELIERKIISNDYYFRSLKKLKNIDIDDKVEENEKKNESKSDNIIFDEKNDGTSIENNNAIKTNEKKQNVKKKKITYNLNYEQREIYIQEYLISEINKPLPGITFIVQNQGKIEKCIINIIGNKGFENLKKLANITNEYKILEFKKLGKFDPRYHIPEYNNYIILIDKDNKKYFMDYINRVKINLENMISDVFDEFSLTLSQVYLISVLNKNLTLEDTD